jgi:hypothetical protein
MFNKYEMYGWCIKDGKNEICINSRKEKKKDEILCILKNDIKINIKIDY